MMWHKYQGQVLRCSHDLTDENEGAHGRPGPTDPQSDDCQTENCQRQK